jgi:hypothetical protein
MVATKSARCIFLIELNKVHSETIDGTNNECLEEQELGWFLL